MRRISEIINKLQNIKNEFGNVNVSTLNVGYNIEMFMLYKKHKVFEEKMEQEIINKYEV